MTSVPEASSSSQGNSTISPFQTLEKEQSIQLSVIIPMYNQGKNAHASLARIRHVLNSMMLSYELVVVNDGSLDSTLDILRSEAAVDDHIHIVTYPKNIGKGYAVKAGVMQTRGDLLVFTDGDMDISPHVIGEYVEQLEKCDLVIASKTHPQSKYNAPASRRFLSRAFNLVVRLLTGISLKDTQSGLKVGNGPALRAIFKLMLVKRYAFDVELLTIASLLKMQIREMPIEINLNRKFKVKDIAKMFVDVLAIAYRLRILQFYQRQLPELSANR